ncbi:MAG: helix-turn-helix domain-containing protein [Planctomycetes bacterium]|nr:helix-turn-helix domain-containing protein [Planctomycetota bacterium]
MKQQEALTTGQVSRICNVAPRTVCRWFDKGLLRGYRVPSTKGRRIPVAELIKFMKEHNMYTETS